jgi:hypothetical protein
VTLGIFSKTEILVFWKRRNPKIKKIGATELNVVENTKYAKKWCYCCDGVCFETLEGACPQDRCSYCGKCVRCHEICHECGGCTEGPRYHIFGECWESYDAFLDAAEF